MNPEILVFLTLAATFVLFLWGPWRYDLVALGALVFLAACGVVPASEMFLGFGNAAVITVAAVLVISRGLMNAGVVDWVAVLLARVGESALAQTAALTGLAACLSGFMNNTGALALLMPAAIRLARKSGRSPSLFLMPLAFASLLGGMTTLIGTPPNIIVAEFRERAASAPFQMFDFAPVGVAAAAAGLVLVALGGSRLVPQRSRLKSSDETFQIGDYLSEVRVLEASKWNGRSLDEIGSVRGGDVVILALIRDDRRRLNPSLWERLRPGDVLILEADAEDLRELVAGDGLELVGDEPVAKQDLTSEETVFVEAVVAPGSRIVGRTVASTRLRWRYGANLLAVARQGVRLPRRLTEVRFREGDVLLIQGPRDGIQEAFSDLDCWPLAERDLKIAPPRRTAIGVGLFAAAVAAAAAGLAPVQLTLSAAAVLYVLTRVVSLDEAYRSLDLPVIVLLAAMMPVGQALETTGGAARIGSLVLMFGDGLAPSYVLALLLAAALILTNLINNAAAAVLMSPVAVSVAGTLSLSPDPFLMAVALGASAAFLTPIGHQANTLVMGPGGYRFGDYWKLGLPLSLLVIAIGALLIPWAWPFQPAP